MPACNVQVLGAKRKTAAGFSNAAAQRAGDLHAGFIFQCDVIQKKTPPALRTKAARLVGRGLHSTTSQLNLSRV
jgi:U4/U6 small nuclear ribonucleoprotein PRP31